MKWGSVSKCFFGKNVSACTPLAATAKINFSLKKNFSKILKIFKKFLSWLKNRKVSLPTPFPHTSGEVRCLDSPSWGSTTGPPYHHPYYPPYHSSCPFPYPLLSEVEVCDLPSHALTSLSAFCCLLQNWKEQSNGSMENGQWNGLPLKNPNAPCPPCLSPNPFFYRPGLFPYVTPPPLMILSEAPPPLLIFSEVPSCVLAPSHLYTPVPSPNPYPLMPPSRRTPNPRKEKWLNGYLSNGNDSMTSNDLLGHSPPVVLYCLAAGQATICPSLDYVGSQTRSGPVSTYPTPGTTPCHRIFVTPPNFLKGNNSRRAQDSPPPSRCPTHCTSGMVTLGPLHPPNPVRPFLVQVVGFSRIPQCIQSQIRERRVVVPTTGSPGPSLSSKMFIYATWYPPFSKFFSKFSPIFQNSSSTPKLCQNFQKST